MNSIVSVLVVLGCRRENVSDNASQAMCSWSWGPWWQRWRTSIAVWVCRELVREWGGSSELDGACCLDQEVDPLLVFQELMDGPGPHWGRYVVYVRWLHDTYGPDRAGRVLQTLQIRNPHHIPRIWILLARWALTPRCGPGNAPPV